MCKFFELPADDSSLQDHLADDFRIHLQQISEDFQRLESRIRALARENADLKSGKSTLPPVAGKVVFGGDHLQDSLENQFEEALGGGFKHFLFSPLLGEMIQFD